MDRINWLAEGGIRIESNDWDRQDASVKDEMRKAWSWVTNLSGNAPSLVGNLLTQSYSFWVTAPLRIGLIGTPINPNLYKYTGGIVCINGEFFRLQSATIDLAVTPFLYVEIQEAALPGGTRTPQTSTGDVETWFRREAKLVGYATAQTGKIAYNDLKKMKDWLKSLVAETPDTWHTVGASSGDITGGWQNGWSAINPVKIRKDGNIVNIVGMLSSNGNVEEGIVNIFTINSADYRPQNQILIPIIGTVGADYGKFVGNLQINTNGIVSLNNQSGTNGKGFNLGSIIYSVL